MSVLEWGTGLTVYKPEKCYNGYTIYAPLGSPYVYMIDMNGRVVHMWTVGIEKSRERGVTIGTTWYYKYLKNNHHILANVIGFGLKEMDWNSNVVWEYFIPNAHHDFCRMNNGNTMILYNRPLKDERVSSKPLIDDCFREVTPEGEAIWEWSATEHFEEFDFDIEAKKLIYDQGGDYLHINTVEVLPNGDILSCSRNANMIFIVSRATGRVIWMWGRGPDGLIGPHNPTMLENGNILVYDNGGSAGYPPRHRFYTRLVEVNPKTNEIVWEYSFQLHVHPHVWFPYRYKVRFLSLAWGNAQRLPNGNTLSLDAPAGRLFEITRDGELVWEYVNPFFAQCLHPTTIMDPEKGAATFEGRMRIEKGVYRCYRITYEDAPEEARRYYFD
jgi:hypothetical protein